MALRPHAIGPDDGQRWAGVGQEEKVLDWLHDSYFAAVAGDAPAFEAWPTHAGTHAYTPSQRWEHFADCELDYYLHEYILALWGMPLGEMLDLEKLAKTCRAKNRWTFFVSSAPANVPGESFSSLLYFSIAVVSRIGLTFICTGGVSSHVNANAIF